MKAILRTYNKEAIDHDKLVDIDDAHDFAQGPYQDTVGFSVGSNQSILPWDGETRPEGIPQEDWFDLHYEPVAHPKTITGNEYLLETFGADLDLIQKTDKTHVWTLTETEEGNMGIQAGMHTINRIGYLTTKRPWKTGKETFLY